MFSGVGWVGGGEVIVGILGLFLIYYFLELFRI